MSRHLGASVAVAVASLSALSCNQAGGPSPSAITSVREWTGTLKILARQSGSGTSNVAGFSILENFTHDSEAILAVTLVRDPSISTLWVGPAQGSVTITNQNVMTMTPLAVPITCTGTLFWIGNDPIFTGTVRLEASSANTIRFSLQPTRIPAPNSGSVECPFAGLQFPTVDPNSPFGPTDLTSGLSMVPATSSNQSLFAFATALGDSGIGGFVASPFRVSYTVDLNLTAR